MSIPNRIARLNADGSTDTSFAVGTGLSDTAYCVQVLKDGKVAVGGAFTLPRTRLAIFNANGSLHPANVPANWDVYGITEQTDGRVLVMGRFTTIAGSAFNKIARLSSALALEPAFNPDANGTVRCVALTQDGKLYAGGSFTGMGDRARDRLVRLFNDPAVDELNIITASLLTWTRAGSLNEALRTVWEVNTGSGYGILEGTVTRISGGWQMIPTTALSGDGSVRVRAVLHDSHSGGEQEVEKSFNFAPEIAVEIGGVDTASGGTLAFGDVQAGTTRELQVTIRNVGLATLTISSVTLGGTAAARYTKVDPALSVPAQTATVCTVRFTPTTLGAQPATLTIASDDDDEASFLINLLGTATPGPGGVDTSWQPSITGDVRALTVMPGELVLGGSVTAVNAQSRRRWGRLRLTTAAELPQSGSVPATDVFLAVPDLRGGVVLFLQALSATVTSTAVAHRFVNGVQDTSFRLTWPRGLFHTAALMPDGAMLVATVPTGLRRITPEGTFDTTFPTWIDTGTVFKIAVLPSGAFYLGFFRSTAPIVVRCHPNGTRDTTFAPVFTPGSLRVIGMEPCADGGLMLLYDSAGTMLLRKLLPSGEVDSAWIDRAWTSVPTDPGMQMQADGGLIFCGGLSGAVGITRLLSTSAVDSTWSGPALLPSAMTQDDNGRVYYSQGATLKRLINTATPAVLAVPSTNRVTWVRGGSLPEVSWVRLDLTEDGTNWQHLGLCTRMTGGWEKTGLNLPRNGRVRVQAYTGSGLITAEQTYANLPVPDLVIERSNVALGEGAFVSFEGRIKGGAQSSDVTLTLRNVGLADLTSLVAAVSTSDFRVVSLGLPGQADPTTLAALQETQLVLRFTPTLTSARNGTLTITSNVPGTRGRVTLTLVGNGITNPAATTQAATMITRTAARLNGAFAANDDTAALSFEYRRAIDSAWTSVSVDAAAGFTTATRLADVGGLSPNTDYVFQAVITNSLSTQRGIQRGFTTLP